MAREPQNPGIHRHLFDDDSCIPDNSELRLLVYCVRYSRKATSTSAARPCSGRTAGKAPGGRESSTTVTTTMPHTRFWGSSEAQHA
jgi:hypothetical protein